MGIRKITDSQDNYVYNNEVSQETTSPEVQTEKKQETNSQQPDPSLEYLEQEIRILEENIETKQNEINSLMRNKNNCNDKLDKINKQIELFNECINKFCKFENGLDDATDCLRNGGYMHNGHYFHETDCYDKIYETIVYDEALLGYAILAFRRERDCVLDAINNFSNKITLAQDDKKTYVSRLTSLREEMLTKTGGRR